jgi:class 3 adenylate cyclase/predicted ATPase
MSLADSVERARELLRRSGRVSLRLLRRELALDDETLALVAEELTEVQRVAVRQGDVLAWSEHPQAPSTIEASTAPAPVDAERRQLTVLFCDLVDSTRLAAGLDAEDWRALVQRYHAAAGEVIARFEGHVAQYLGDGILAYFGWPRAHEDDAERAVRAGLGIVEAVRPDLSVRIGIHTGPVVVGEIGDGARRETLAMGDTTNVAARLQGIAEPDAVLMSSSTLRLVSGIFVVRDLGAQALKGKDEPVPAYRVVQPSGMRSRLDAAAGRLTPLVGRDVELATLVDRWERVVDGQGQSVLVIGEAGVGKSRLVYQLRAWLKDVPHTWLECTCTPYTRDTAFSPIIELLQQGLVFQRDESPEGKHAKLERGLALAGLVDARSLRLISAFLGLPPLPGASSFELGPELARRETMDVLLAWNLALSEIQPLVLAVEDLHWADASSLELIGRLIEQSATARVLMVATARPEFVPSWPPRSNLATVQLARLTRRQARAMVRTVAEEALDEDTVEAIVSRADGVPLYVEELTKTVVEPGSARGVDEIPATLQDSLMARLDRLSAAKEVAQRAAVLGREFSYGLLAATAGVEEAALQRALVQLTEVEVLFGRGVPPQATYSFKHALLQEAAYESLLKRTRQELHARVVAVLTRAAEPDAEVVARHAEAAGLVFEAATYFQRAGEQAQARSADEEAIAHLRRALALVAEFTGDAERTRRELKLQLMLGASLNAVRGYSHAESGAAYERATALAEAGGEARDLAEALVGWTRYLYTTADQERCFLLAERAIELAERTRDDVTLVAAHVTAGVPRFQRGELAAALAHLAGAIRAYVPTPRQRYFGGDDPGVTAYAYAAWTLWFHGLADQARERAREAVEMGRRVHHPISVAKGLAFEACVFGLIRDHDHQMQRAEEAIALSEKHGFPLWAGVGHLCRGNARVAGGDGPGGVAEMEAGLRLAAGTGNQAGAPGILGLLAQARATAGQHDAALGAIAAAFAISERTGQRFYDAELVRLHAELSLSSKPGSEPDAEARLRRALEIARRQDCHTFELRAATSLARLWRDQGKHPDAHDLLAPIYAWFTEGFDTLDLVEAKALLGELG